MKNGAKTGVRNYLAALLATTAVALTPGLGQAADGQGMGGLEEITVTARKMAESLQRIPIAVTVITEKVLDDLSITNIKEIDRLTPNLLYSPGFSGSSSGANFFIRGIGQIDFVATADPGVSLYVDGVYYGRTVGAAIDTADIARVEVLKGPQGTLFGKNTIGGAISIVSIRPNNELHGFAEATVGNYGRYDGRFSANVPIADNFFFKLTGVTRNNDGFAKRVKDGVRLGDDRDVAGRISALWKPTEDIEVLLSADATRRRAHIAAHSVLAVAPSFNGEIFKALTGFDVMDFGPSSDPRKINTTSVRPTDNLDVLGTALDVSWDIGLATVRSITSYRRMKNETAADFDGTLLEYNDQELTADQDQFTQELQIASHADQRLRWVAGAYFLKENDFQFTRNIDVQAAFLGVAPTRTIDLHTRNFALFGQATYNLTQKLSVTAGVRWTYEKKEVSIFNSASGPDNLPFTVASEKSWNNVSPRFGLEYQATDALMLYVSATRGFKSGSFNGRPDRANDFIAYKPETVWAYEAGLKSQFLDNRVRLNAAGFYTQYNDIQLITGQFDADNLLFFPVDNAGDVDIKGFELEVQAKPIEPLDLFASVGYATNSWTRIAPIAFVTKDTQLPGLSHWNVAFGGQYAIPLVGFGSLSLGANYSYRSKYFPTVNNSPIDGNKGYSLVDAFIILEPESQRWQVRAWAKNLTDTVYTTAGQDLIQIGDSHAVGWWGRPREYGVTVRINL